MALSPQSIPLYLELAMTAVQQPNLSKTALRAAQDALRIAPSHPVAWEVYSLVSERFERPDAALKFLETAPETAVVQAFRARVLERLKRPQEAIQALRKAIELDPENPNYARELNRVMGATRR